MCEKCTDVNQGVATTEEKRPTLPPRPDVADKYRPLTVGEFEERMAGIPVEKEPKVVNITINL